MHTQTQTPEPILECGHPESAHSSITRGYGSDADGKRYCYQCCAARDRERMETEGQLSAYLSEDGRLIVGWPGYKLLTVTREWQTSAGGFRLKDRVTRVWARDTQGNAWHGRGPGRGMYIRMRKSKDKRRAV